MNQKNTKNSVECMFIYTTDNAQAALDEIKLQIKNAGLEVEDIGIHEEERIFRNAYGKEVSEEEFESYEADSDEAWFEDYDFVIKAEVSSEELDEEEIAELLEEKVSDFIGTEDEYNMDYGYGLDKIEYEEI